MVPREKLFLRSGAKEAVPGPLRPPRRSCRTSSGEGRWGSGTALPAGGTQVTGRGQRQKVFYRRMATD